MSAVAARARRSGAARSRAPPAIRSQRRPHPPFATATAADADAIHALITEHLAEGPPAAARRSTRSRPRAPLRRRRRRTTAWSRCAELAPLSRDGRPRSARWSSAAARAARRLGPRSSSTSSCARATAAGFEKLCAFTHAPSLLRAARLFDRAARLAAREDRHRLPHLPAVPQLRPVRGDADARRAPRQSCVPLAALHG